MSGTALTNLNVSPDCKWFVGITNEGNNCIIFNSKILRPRMRIEQTSEFDREFNSVKFNGNYTHLLMTDTLGKVWQEEAPKQHSQLTII